MGEEVLARWSDDGWYYRGTVRQDCNDGSYLVEDSAGCFEKIGREDIIADSDDAHIVIEPEDTVIALHPSYSFSYTPAVVLRVTPDHWVEVQCYDGTEAKLPRDEVFRIPPEKFRSDISYIQTIEQDWVGQAVVARNDESGTFHLGLIRQRTGNGRQYEVEWADGTQSVQDSTFIFGPFTKCHPVSEGDRVLAIADQDNLVYLPGKIVSDGHHRSVIKFCDGSVQRPRWQVDKEAIQGKGPDGKWTRKPSKAKAQMASGQGSHPRQRPRWQVDKEAIQGKGPDGKWTRKPSKAKAQMASGQKSHPRQRPRWQVDKKAIQGKGPDGKWTRKPLAY
ncbi:hypothetical protein LSAT2_010272 [Lamellibrachia satsuma]|nr:hypothetical protein LSAT2_010272 [Lamellibrachia satsuma]